MTVGIYIVTPLHPLLNGKPLKGWLLSPLAQNLRTALLPSTVPKGQLSVFSPARILLTYLCFYKRLLTLLLKFPYLNLEIMCQIQMLKACKWHYFLFFCQYASFNMILCHTSVYFSCFLIALFSHGYIFPFWMHFPNFLFPAAQTVQFLNCRQAAHMLYFFVASIEQSPACGPLFPVGLRPNPSAWGGTNCVSVNERK